MGSSQTGTSRTDWVLLQILVAAKLPRGANDEDVAVNVLQIISSDDMRRPDTGVWRMLRRGCCSLRSIVRRLVWAGGHSRTVGQPGVRIWHYLVRLLSHLHKAMLQMASTERAIGLRHTPVTL